MNCQSIERLIPAALMDELNEKEKASFDEHLANCSHCRELYAEMKSMYSEVGEMPVPGDFPGLNFGEVMARYESIGNKKGTIVRQLYRYVAVAAASLLLFLAGYFVGGGNGDQVNVETELASLHRELAQTKNLVIMNLIKQQSASKRIMAVSYAEGLTELSEEVEEALFYTLDNDMSANVRLAALEALANFASNPEIRQRLVDSFHQQSDPVIQVILINLMVSMKDQEFKTIMNELIESDSTPDIVKREAQIGLEILKTGKS